ncbi:DUF4383 domain-containing protein [Streptomyces xinghaiensis]|uniref:DUF4383 domain-containing protein n=1 Tax=Streptomyces xinghaiensis TaxID=1038928 RepID=UPI0002FBB7A4|nr:DUF4383 domain-containing protein [Streptomyces xinghaiensis]MZE78680.1 DUF4383 domain-containing protein [Streptomyces sp. SID5475]
MSAERPPAARRGLASPAAATAGAVLTGAVFTLVGLLGFIPGITTRYGGMEFAGPHSSALLFGLFGVSVLHNLVHLAFGAAGLSVARAPRFAKPYLVVGGVLYLLLWVYGVGVHRSTAWNFLGLNGPDNWLHLGLGFGMLTLGSLLGTPRRPPDSDEAYGR